MTRKEHIEFWIQKSDDDLQTAQKMYDIEIYDWALFVGHLSLEKILKAVWIKYNNDNNPPEIRNLVTLTKKIRSLCWSRIFF